MVPMQSMWKKDIVCLRKYFLFICILEVDNMKICEMLEVEYMANTWYSSTLCSIEDTEYKMKRTETYAFCKKAPQTKNERANERVVDHTKTQFHDEFKVKFLSLEHCGQQHANGCARTYVYGILMWAEMRWCKIVFTKYYHYVLVACMCAYRAALFEHSIGTGVEKKHMI